MASNIELRPIAEKKIVNSETRDFFYESFERVKEDLQKKEKVKPPPELFPEWQFAETSYNIIASGFACPNACIYCYMIPMNERFGRGTIIPDIEEFPVNEKRVEKKWLKVGGKRKPKYYMFPSSHDLFPEMVEPALEVIRKILIAGHDLTIVSKPRIPVVDAIVNDDIVKNNLDRIVMRFSISTLDEDLVKKFEPNAPTIKERIECLRISREAGLMTGVSVEPYISDPVNIVEGLEKTGYVSEDYFVGVMTKEKTIAGTSEWDMVEPLYTREYLTSVIERLRDNKKVFFKTSIMKMYISLPRKIKKKLDE
jgi:DNA repair photolyase